MLGISYFSRAQEPIPVDSTYHLQGVMVTALRSRYEVVQPKVLSGKQLEQVASFSVADALRTFSGVQVRDYGGIGGVKTINIRSMGSHHVGFFYDGVELGNAQNGQIDLGQYSLDNIERVEVYHGQKSTYLQTAKDFASSGTVYLTTRTPSFQGKEKQHFTAKIRTGSFGLFNPSLYYEYKLSPHLAFSLSAEPVAAHGRYRFRYRKMIPGTDVVAYDTTAVRENGDITSLRLEGTLFGATSKGRYTFKVYHFGSERGIPGAIVNNVWYRSERMWDNNNFAQAYANTFLTPKLRLSAIAKWAHYGTRYKNGSDAPVPIDTRFRQLELYTSLAASYELHKGWYAALAYDFLWNHLSGDRYGFVWPRRQSHFVALSTTYSGAQVKVQGALLTTWIIDKTKQKDTHPRFNRYSPSVTIAWQPLRNLPLLHINAFYKHSFRMPSFNDLYYTDFGNPQLLPETTQQLSAGIDYTHHLSKDTSLAVRCDAYYNRVHNKIVAYPKGQQFRWTMLNLGRVAIRGIDASLSFQTRPTRSTSLELRSQYTYQKAIDVTNPENSYYKHQIPYIPLHSGSVNLALGYKQWLLAYNMQYTGARFSASENIFVNYVPRWNTHDLSLSYDFTLWKCHMQLLAECNNLFNRQYEVIINYPMPGRNFRITLKTKI